MATCSPTTEARAGRPAAGVAGRAAPVAGAVVLALLFSACSPGNSTRLPELATLPRGLLSKEEQKKAVEDLQERRKVHRTEAIEEIKSARRD